MYLKYRYFLGDVFTMSKKMRYYLSIFSLSVGGSSIFLLMYVRYVFYDQMIETMHVTNTQLGLLTTFSSAVGLLLLPVKGYVSDRFDSKRVIIISIASMSALAFLYGFITTYQVAIVVWALMGVSTGLGYWQSLIKFINGLGEPEEAGKSFSLYYGIYGVVAALVNVVEVWAGGKFGFHGAVFVIASINGIAAVMDIFLLDGDRDKIKRGEMPAPVISDDDKVRISDIKYVLKWPGTYILGLCGFCTYMLYSNVSYFNPYLVNVMGVPAEVSSTLSVIRTYFLMLVCPIGGVIADKIFKSTAKAFVLMFSISAVLFAVVFFFKPGMNMWVAAVYSLVPSLVVMPLYSISNSVIRELHVPNSILGTTIAISGITGTLVDMVPPAIYGHWLDKYGNGGYNMIFMSLIVICAGGVLSALWARSHDKKCKEGKRVMDIGRNK